MSEITIYKPEQVAVAFKSDELKAKAVQIAQQCNEIEIVDDSSLAIAQALLTNANKTVSAIEKTRKTLKQPFMDMGKRIDTVAKDLSEVMSEAVKSGKDKILAYNSEVEKRKAEEQAELERQAEKARQEAAAEQTRIDGITDWIKDFESTSVEEINSADSVAKLASVYSMRIKPFPEDEFFAEFIDEAKAALERVKLAGKARREYLDRLAKEEDTKKAAELKRKEEKRQQIVERNMTESAAALEEKKEEVVQVVQDTADMKAAEITGQSVALQNEKVSGITKRWNFEIIDLNQIPRSFLKVDEVGIRKWMNDNVGILVDGETISGIKYFVEKGVRLS